MQGSETLPSLSGVILGGRYRLLRLIKAGGMGAVYEADDIKLERLVAVKILDAELTREPEMVRRLFREARAASQIRHPNIVEYLDYDQVAGGPAYLVMELLEGRDLEGVLKQRGPIPWPTLAPWLRDACRALSAAHAVGIIHRDIKPSNFVLSERPDFGEPILKLIDFGIVKLTPVSRLRGDPETDQGLLGTEIFMAPEIFTGVMPNPRTEVYALGVSIYRLLTGQYPRSETYEPIPPSRLLLGVPPEVDALVEKCLELRPHCRFDSMAALEAAILETLTVCEAPIEPRPVLPAPKLVMFPWSKFWVVTLTLLVGCLLFMLQGPSKSSSSNETLTVAPVASLVVTPVATPVVTPLAIPPVVTPVVVPPVHAAAPAPPPAKFSERAASKLLDRLVARAEECGKRENLLPGGKVKLQLQISPAGIPRVAAKLRTLKHVKCVVKLVETLRFESSASGGQLAYEYTI